MKEACCITCRFRYYKWQISEDGVCEYCHREQAGNEVILTQ